MNAGPSEAIHLRLSVELLEQVRRVAQQERRTIAQTLRIALEDAFAARPKKEPKK